MTDTQTPTMHIITFNIDKSREWGKRYLINTKTLPAYQKDNSGRSGICDPMVDHEETQLENHLQKEESVL